MRFHRVVDTVNPDLTASLPVRKLLAAILARAVRDLANVRIALRDGGSTPTGVVAHEVEMWFRSQDRTFAFSYLTICDELGLDPEAVFVVANAGNPDELIERIRIHYSTEIPPDDTISQQGA